MQLPDKCSFGWAKKLAEAGYPQPAYAPGQLWYDKYGRPLLISSMYASGVFHVANLKTNDMGRVMDLRDGQIYAPGVEELMKRISFNGYYSPDVYYAMEYDNFTSMFDLDVSKDHTRSKNLCDALAEAWIENHKHLLSDEKE